MRKPLFRFLSCVREPLLTFLLGLSSGILLFLIAEICPFGIRSLVSMDGWSQYYPMLRELKAALKAGNLLYSFHGGLGFDLLSQTAYYTGSPLWLFLCLLPERLFTLGIHLLTLLRFGLAAMTFDIFCRKALNRTGLFPCVLGLAYSFSTYSIAFINQFMWADTVVLLPLVLLGLHRLTQRRRPGCYFLALFLTLICNFYLGYMVCLFSVLYFALLLFGQKRSPRAMWAVTGRFALWSLLAGGSAAALLLPTFLALQQTAASDLTLQSVRFLHGFGEIFRNMLPFARISLEYGAPNLYCGALTLLLLPLFLFCRALPLRRRVGCGLLAAFLLFSMSFSPLDYVWHGFHEPNFLPGRESFLYIFLALSMAAEAAPHLWEMPRRALLLCLLVPLTAVGCYYTALPEVTDVQTAVPLLGAGVLLAEFVPLFFLTGRPGPARRRALGILLSALMAGETLFSAGYLLCWHTWTSLYDTIADRDTTMAAAVARYESGDSDFYRTEWMPISLQNPGQMYGFRGITYYSSTMTADTYRFLTKAGCSVYARNVSIKYVPTPVLNTLLGVKYIYDLGDNSQPGLTPVDKIGGVTVLENEYPLPLMYAVSDNIRSFCADSTDGPADFQNRLLEATGAAAAPVFLSCKAGTPLQETGDYYLELSRETGQVFLQVNGGPETAYSAANMTMLYLGRFQKGDILTLRAEGSSDADLRLYRFHEDRFACAVETLSAHSCRIVSARSGRLEAEVEAPEAETLLITLPFSRGWRLTCDGETLPLSSVDGFFSCVSLPAGSHRLTLRYVSPGFPLGCCISAASLCAAGVLFGTLYRRRRKKRPVHCPGPAAC